MLEIDIPHVVETRHHGRAPGMRLPLKALTALLAAVLAAGTAAPVQQSSAASARWLWDFESEPVGAPPAGCETPAGTSPAAVTDTVAATGRQALELADGSATGRSGLRCVTGAMPGADLRVAVRPETLGDGLLVTLLGGFTGIDRPDTPVFHLWAKPDGSLFWWDGLVQDALGWTQIGPAGIVPAGTWSTLTVQVRPDLAQAQVYVAPQGDGAPSPATYVGAAGPVGVTPVSELTGFELATAHPAAATDVVHVDDLSWRDGRQAPRAPRQADFRLGQRATIDFTDEGFMQMPNSSTTRRLPGGGQEVLVTYPVHGDATHDTGTALAASTDNGRTWTDVSERNPFPDEQSFQLTALRNGDLLAVNYHTFMTAGSGNLQAAVPTAVSSDGGRTWTHREGRMTAPEPMRPISDATSRPGFPLGGFVLVHSIVEDDDGTLYQTGYGYYAPDRKARSVLLASTDGGVDWTVRGTIGFDPELSDHPRFEGHVEAAVAIAADDAMVAVMRTGNYQPLQWARSTDRGRTWTEPTPVVAGPDDIVVTGVFPDLKLMESGTLVLWVGRPGQFLLASPDGTGREWSSPVTVDYLNSGNGTITPVSRNTLLTFGDRGADWTPNTNRRKEIWTVPVIVAPPRPGG